MTFLDYFPDEPVFQLLLAAYLLMLAMVVYYGFKFLGWFMQVISPGVPLPKFTWSGWIITSLTLGAGIVARELILRFR